MGLGILEGMSVTLFMMIVLGYLIAESVLLYWGARFFTFLLTIPFVLVVYQFFVQHEISFLYLAAYPIVAGLWTALYWYMTMSGNALEISNGIKRSGSLEKYYGSLPYSSEYRKHIKKNESYGEPTTYEVDIQHPPAADLAANGLLFIPSMLIFFFDNFFRAVYNSLWAYMESVRKSFSDAINRSLPGVNDEQK